MNERLYRQVVEESNDGIRVVQDGTVVFVNERLCEMTGYDEAEILGTSKADIVAPEYKQTVEAHHHARVAGEPAPSQYEVELETADGERLPVELSATRIDYEGEPASLVLHRDISQRRREEAATEQARAQLRQVIDLVPDPVFAIDGDGEYVLVNEAMATLFGTTPPAMVGETPAALGRPALVDRLHDSDESVLESGDRLERAAVELPRDDGADMTVQLTKIPYTVAGTGQKAVLGYARDITARRASEERLETQRDNLELLNQVVRHDIRNDLQLVTAYAELLEDHVDEAGQEHLETVVENATSAVELTRTARDVAAVVLRSDADRAPVDLGRVIEDQLEEVRSSYERAVVTTDGPIPSMTVLADDMLASVVRNLLTNAIEHNDTEPPTVTVSATVDDEQAVVRVADDGPGIPDNRKEAIFERNERGLDSDGTGLGLYLVETLVDRYGGAIRVEDNDPRGSVFIVELPTTGT